MQQTIGPGHQGHRRQNTTAQLRNERRGFPFSNRQGYQWISERLARGSVWRRELLNPRFWLAESSVAWLPLPSPVTPADVPSRWPFRGSERKRHCFAISGPEIYAAPPPAQLQLSAPQLGPEAPANGALL